ncbi:MAG: hypothetical protein HYV63_06325 [Candidatus Schekmanbacteria bacterium]|nr:hypothetical protein [Candidatus Schekmanbacteria bacterium]
MILQVVDVLEDLAIPFHLGGSFASSIHGAPRQTRDADLVADLGMSHVAKLVSRLERDFYVDAEMIREAVARRSSFNAIHFATSFKVDLSLPTAKAGGF